MAPTRIVVVHGPVTPELALTLTKSGLTVVAAGADTTIYGTPNEPPAPPTPQPTTLDPALLTIPDAAAQLGLGRSSVYRLIDTGQLEVVHVGRSVRVPVGAVTDLVDRLRRRPRRPSSTGGGDGPSGAVASKAEEPSPPLAPPAPQLSEHH